MSDARGVAPAPPDLEAIRARWQLVKDNPHAYPSVLWSTKNDVFALLSALSAARDRADQAERERDDHEWLKRDYGRITGALQDACHRHGLGLGGEDVCELVVAALATARRDSLEEAAKAVAAEPELPDAMPDEMWSAIQFSRTATEAALRATVRLTKSGIAARVRALAAPDPDTRKDQSVSDPDARAWLLSWADRGCTPAGVDFAWVQRSIREALAPPPDVFFPETLTPAPEPQP